ncbi:Retrovirus-related Pol poly from transposon [Brachionus plicatilis]|uniref:Retrovirus-related Pol poly from transposon n=1 Tax=Brachionus plicatilis TaxID=10195 RepID=A0A3M7P649_BRAPC|nr:Retrovirus-related Pol poly from transposon [Brachionus plicatilis]
MPYIQNGPKVDSQFHQKARQSDLKAKAKMKAFNDKNLKAQVVDFKVGDIVILKWKRARKSCSLFDPNPFKVIKIEGSMITVERDGKILVRNSSFMKLYVQEKPTSTFEEFLFDKSYQGNETLELTLTDTDEGGGDEVVQMEAVTGTEDEGKNDFETSQNSGVSDEVVSVEGRPTRVVKKPDRYGQPVEYGTRPYVRRNSNQKEEE